MKTAVLVVLFTWYLIGVTGAWVVFRRMGPIDRKRDIAIILLAGTLGPMTWIG